VQQSLVADLTAAAPGRVVSGDVASADLAAAVAAGREASARYVVFGTFAVNGPQARIVGQIVDVETGQPLAAPKATAEGGSGFDLEDEFSSQVARHLGLGAGRAAVAGAEPGPIVQTAPAGDVAPARGQIIIKPGKPRPATTQPEAPARPPPSPSAMLRRSAAREFPAVHCGPIIYAPPGDYCGPRAGSFIMHRGYSFPYGVTVYGSSGCGPYGGYGYGCGATFSPCGPGRW
jgi:hypothetical protein